MTVCHIGKESNLIEQQEDRVLTTDPQAVYLAESNLEEVRSQLDRVSIPKLADLSGVSPEMLRKIRQGERRPSAKTLRAIMEGLAQMLDEAEG
ncbi:MAG: helix-turn-helix transcriptional regulator [Deltaproteobacteria bacterium]|nr:helix-turn-helix transcriptional regulator [Deltaproteobacteria bacterium]